MLLPLLLGFAVAAAEPPTEKPVDPVRKQIIDDAMECFVYMDVARSAYANDPIRIQVVAKLFPYWSKRYKDLASEEHWSREAIEMRPLVIPISAERLPVVFLRCLEATPRKALQR